MEDAGEAIKSIRERADKFQSIFENSAMGIFQSSLDGRFLAVNPAFARIFGYESPQDLIESIKSIDSDFYRSSAQRGKILSVIENKSGMARFETEFRRKDGAIITCSLNIRAIRDSDGRITHLDGFIEDVTEAALWKREIQERTEHLSRENLRLRTMFKDRYRFGKIVGKSPAMQEIFDDILQAAGNDVSVIIYGESGTGKELIATAIHDLSRRRNRHFVPVNCGAIPQHLLESEFFGHKKGAYTGAVSDTKGFLERADGGTLFLDEIGELSLDMQVKLLRALEGGNYFPLGESKPAKSDFRLISATNRNLKEMVKDGRMREDFFFRIDIVPIDLPPLRKRREDIPLLIDHHLRQFTGADNPPVLPGRVLEALYKYDYPGNIRELQNILQRYLTTRRLDLTGIVEQEAMPETSGPLEEKISLQERVSLFEKGVIERYLALYHWNRNRTAAALRIDRKTLYTKMKSHGLTSPHYGEK